MQFDVLAMLVLALTTVAGASGPKTMADIAQQRRGGRREEGDGRPTVKAKETKLRRGLRHSLNPTK